MKSLKTLCACAMLACSATLMAQDQLETEQQQFSYMIGMDIGSSLKKINMELDLDALMMAIKHVLNDEQALLGQEEVAALRNTFMQKMQAEQQAKQQAMATENKTISDAFLAENKNQEGVQTTDTGLQYKVIKEGDGPKPSASDTVTVHYRGTLVDGTEFDSSYSRNQPATFPLNGVIPGWTQGLQLMPQGSTYRLFVPPELGYGERGAGQRIGPNAVLIFDVELLEIK